jgi:hypothetical protein
VPGIEQFFDKIATDKTRGACDQYAHGAHPKCEGYG